MGAYYQEITMPKMSKKALASAWLKLVAQESWDNGHSGYTGTFAEKDSVLEVIPGVWETDKAKRHCEDNNDKWEAAYAYKLNTGEWYVGGWCSS